MIAVCPNCNQFFYVDGHRNAPHLAFASDAAGDIVQVTEDGEVLHNCGDDERSGYDSRRSEANA